MASSPAPPPAWHPDPTGRSQYRYWDGAQWTDQAASDGAQTTDPLKSGEPDLAPPLRTGEGAWMAAWGNGGESDEGTAPPSLSSKWLRLGANLLEGVVAAFTFWIGWIVWSLIIWRRGQTPGKQILGMRVVNVGRREGLSWKEMALREMVLKGGLVVLLVVALGLVTGSGGLLVVAYLLSFLWWLANCVYLLASENSQALWDKMGDTAVINDRHGRFDPRVLAAEKSAW